MRLINRVIRLDSHDEYSVQRIDFNSFDSILIDSKFDGLVNILINDIPNNYISSMDTHQIGDIIFLTRTIFIRKYDYGKYVLYNKNLSYPKNLFQPDDSGILELTVHIYDEPWWIDKLSGYVDSFKELFHLLTDKYFNKHDNILNKFISVIDAKYIDVFAYTVEFRFREYIIIILKSLRDECDIIEEKYLIHGGFPNNLTNLGHGHSNKLFKI